MFKCKQAKFDRYFSERICHKYGLPCRVACRTCREPEFETDPAKWRSVL